MKPYALALCHLLCLPRRRMACRWFSFSGVQLIGWNRRLTFARTNRKRGELQIGPMEETA